MYNTNIPDLQASKCRFMRFMSINRFSTKCLTFINLFLYDSKRDYLSAMCVLELAFILYRQH